MKTARQLTQVQDEGFYAIKPEGVSHTEQRCSYCQQWKAAFAPTFDRCFSCRNVVMGFTGVEDLWNELPGTPSEEWLARLT